VPISRNRTQGLAVQGGSVFLDLTALCIHHGEQRDIGNRGYENTPCLCRGDGNQDRKGDTGSKSESTIQAGPRSNSALMA